MSQPQELSKWITQMSYGCTPKMLEDFNRAVKETRDEHAPDRVPKDNKDGQFIQYSPRRYPK